MSHLEVEVCAFQAYVGDAQWKMTRHLAASACISGAA